jgi:tetratricopeptide (TPR) repeat protein
VRKDYDRAEEFYGRALKADPHHASVLANYAGLLLARAKDFNGLPILGRAIQALSPDAAVGVDVEIWFYAFAHRPAPQRGEALANLKKLIIEKGSRSPDWDLSQNVQRAVQTGHPDAVWLPKLAEVINGKAEPSILADWPAWRDAK